MNHIRHPMPGRTTPRPPPTTTHGSPLPFLHEPTGCAGHDLLVLNTRPDLAPGHASFSNRHAWQAARFIQNGFPQDQP